MRQIIINQYIVADPDICHGQLTFKGTRIMVWQILDLLGAGVLPKQIRRDYFPQLTEPAILAAVEYASKLIAEERYALFSPQPA